MHKHLKAAEDYRAGGVVSTAQTNLFIKFKGRKILQRFSQNFSASRLQVQSDFVQPSDRTGRLYPKPSLITVIRLLERIRISPVMDTDLVKNASAVRA